MKWPHWMREMSLDGDLLMSAITNIPPDPERRAEQIRREMRRVETYHAALRNELSQIRNAGATQ